MTYDFRVGDRVLFVDNDGEYPEGQECTITFIIRDYTAFGEPLNAYDLVNIQLDDGEQLSGYFARRFQLIECNVDLPALPDASILFS